MAADRTPSAAYTKSGGGGSKETDARSSHRASAAAETGSESRVRVPAPASSAACPNCGHALAKTNRGWWWCSRCERRMRLKDSVARDDLAGTMPDAGHEAGEPATDASAARTWPKIGLARERGCTCRPEVVAAKPKNGRYIGHEASCRLHWKVTA